MPGLRDAIDAATIAPPVPRQRSAPTGWEPGVRFDPASGLPVEVTTEQVATDATDDPSLWGGLTAHLLPMVPAGHVLRLVEARYDPVAWTRDRPHGEDGQPLAATTRPAWRYRFRIVPDDEPAAVVPDTAALVVQVRSVRRARRSPRTVAAARLVGASDLQVGKVDADGGTDALLARVVDRLDKLDELCREEPTDDLVIADPGDLIENSWSTTQQAHTNDLAVPDQLRISRVILTEIVARLSSRAKRTRVATVPSNHGQWRVSQGEKGRAGRPGDDFGLDVHRAVAEAFRLAGRDVSFIVPEPWVESLALEVTPGFVLGLVHGHQWRPGKAAEWWRGQSLGDGPTAAAHMLLHGHWHNASLAQAGNLDGRPRWVVGLDPMDGGSSWWTNLTGERSEPSITTLLVGADGRWDGYRRIT